MAGVGIFKRENAIRNPFEAEEVGIGEFVFRERHFTAGEDDLLGFPVEKISGGKMPDIGSGGQEEPARWNRRHSKAGMKPETQVRIEFGFLIGESKLHTHSTLRESIAQLQGNP